MGYQQSQLAKVTGPTKGIAWTLVILGAGLLLFLAWHQIMEAGYSERYGIKEDWTGPLSVFAVFVLFEGIAFYAAFRRWFGLSIFFGGFIVMFLGFLALILLSGAGM